MKHMLLDSSSDGTLFIFIIGIAVLILYLVFRKSPPPTPPPSGYVDQEVFLEEARKAEQLKAQIEKELWMKTTGAKLRTDAHNRSTGVKSGKSFEHIVAFAPGFPFYPDEVRFVGSPIDLLAFEGVEDEEKDITIWFVEVKTGSSKLSTRQQRIKDAILNNRVKWMEATATRNGLEITPRDYQK
jgi:predicted Holliday junction resolvase-like endonuclease